MRQGTCERCGKNGWINLCGSVPNKYGAMCWQEICAECFDSVGPLEKKKKHGVSDRRDNADPGFDNTVRAYEEDR